MKEKNYETPLLIIEDIECVSVLCGSNGVDSGTNESVEFDNWN